MRAVDRLALTASSERTRARAFEFQRRTLELVSEEMRPIEAGWLIRKPALPLVWNLNEVRVTRPIDYTEALRLADEHLGELPYRQLVVEDQPSGWRLEAAFRADGWRVEREVTMALVRGPDREVDTDHVREAGEDDALALMARWADEDMVAESPEATRQLAEFNRLAWRARGAGRFGVTGAGGALAAITMLFSDGSTAQVEDVYTVPEERGHGFARALVTHAAALARNTGHELTFIVADDNDWPRELYGRIGFEPIGHAWLFHRGPDAG